MQSLTLELRGICLRKARECTRAYQAAYQGGGPEYDARMKAAADHERKWTLRAARVLTDPRLQNALIKWI